jgi:hypothetical protein
MTAGAVVTSTACGVAAAAGVSPFLFACADEPPQEAAPKPSAATSASAINVLT